MCIYINTCLHLYILIIRPLKTSYIIYHDSGLLFPHNILHNLPCTSYPFCLLLVSTCILLENSEDIPRHDPG